MLVFRLALAGIFGVAGVAKFTDLAGSRRAMIDFGVPGSLAGVFSIALPMAEIAVALSLLLVETSWFGSLAGAGLLLVFVAGMVWQMIKGNAPDCHCFGQLHSEPVSGKSLARNIVFLLPALMLVVAGRSGQGMSIANMSTEVVQLLAILIGVALLAAAIFYLRRISEQQTQIMRRIELLDLLAKDGQAVERPDAGAPHDGLPIGAIVPDFELTDVDGNPFTRTTMLDSGLPTFFFYVSTTCSPCGALAPKFVEWSTALGKRINFVLISSGTPEQNAEKFGTSPDRTLILQDGRAFVDLIALKWTPAAVLVDAMGRIASHVATGDAAIVELAEQVKASDLSREYLHFALSNGNGVPSKISIGEPVPEFSIAAVNGETVSSADLRGKPTLLTFWSPTCGYCAKMIDEIKDWDLAKGESDPSLIVFSSGDLEEHRSIGLRSPIVLDKDYVLAGKLGMFGTPSALLIDEHGRYASEIAIGAGNIWSLIGKK